MFRRITAFAAAAALFTSALPSVFVSAGAEGDVWLPNPVNAHEKLDRGLTAMITENGVYLTWRLQADEDPIYGTGSENVTFDIYRDGTKLAEKVDSTNFIDESGTASSQYQVVKSGEAPAATEPAATPFASGSNYFDIPVQKPADAQLYVPVSEAGATPAPAADESDSDSGGESVVDDESAEDASSDTTADDWTTMTKEYTIGDSSCGDLDGDGEYEIVVKWDCNPKDNAHGGHTGNVLLDAYKLDGTLLWRVDLGENIRAGAHYTQFLVYDFDGDGKAEVTCKTAPGSKDADGEYVTKAGKTAEIAAVTDEVNKESHVTEYGRVTTGDEYFTVFNGETGKAMDTIYYPNQRLAPSVWGDSDTWGNRVDRFTATVAYLDGKKPYAVYMRGYYYGRNRQQRQAACGISFDGEKLDCKYSYDSYDVSKYKDPSGYTSTSFREDGTYKGVIGYEEKYKDYYAQGNHNCAVADVDNDGRDEVLTGAMCYEVNGEDKLRPKWTTWKGHGDALHIGDYDPTHSGYEFFVVHEEGGGGTDHGVTLDYGMSLIDPQDGTLLFHEGCSGDNGRGIMANVGLGGYYQFWSAKCGALRMVTDSSKAEGFLASSKEGLSQNFRIFWDGDLYEELMNGTSITSWNEKKLETEKIFTAQDCISVNGTKAVPALSADLFGDWREEVVFPTSDNTRLRVYTTDIYTEHKMKSLMYDNVYRCGVSAEQAGYNQPPHIGYYLDTGINGITDEQPKVTIPENAEEISYTTADTMEPGTYYNFEEMEFDGIKARIGGTKSSAKYFAVVRSGLKDNVFKLRNGDYAQGPARSVTVSFTDAPDIQDGRKAGVTFAVKLFDGTDGTKCRLSFLSNHDVNSKWTDYAGRITSFSTDDLTEGEWGIVRYEYDGGRCRLYLNDELIDVTTTDAGLPELGITFRNSNGYQPYTEMIFDDIHVYTEALPMSSLIYERGTEENPWTSADADTWEETKKSDILLNYDETNNRLWYNPSSPKASNTASKTFEVKQTAASLIYDLNWYFGNNPNKTNYEFIQFGSNLRFGWDSSYRVNLRTGENAAFETIASPGSGSHSKNIYLEIDLLTNAVKTLIFDGKYLKAYTGVTVENPNTVSFGLNGTKNAASWSYPCGIDGITVTQLLNKHTLEALDGTEPIRTTYTTGTEFDPTEMVVKAVYDDGTNETLFYDDGSSQREDGKKYFTVTGFDSSTEGTKTLTASYTEDGVTKNWSFDVLVASDSVELLDGRYRTAITGAKFSVPWGIGSHTGDFVIEHKTTIHSLPPNGVTAKDVTDGFNLIFYPVENTVNGAGWYITASEGDKASIIWKSASTTTVANNNILVGETYTFRYDFTDVGTNASVKMSIIDSSGSVVAEKSGLDLRTMSGSGANRSKPLTNATVYLESTEDRMADVDISEAKKLTKETIEAITIDYQNEQLKGFDPDGSYTIDGKAVTAANGAVDAASYIGRTITAVKKGDGISTADSREYTMTIPERPTKPAESLLATHETNQDKNGSISGTTAAMEYSADETQWLPASDGATEGLSAGTYYIRYKATDSAFAGEHTAVTVGQQDKFTVVFMNGGEAADTQYVVSGEKPASPSAPSKAADAQYSYSFAGWAASDGATEGITDLPAVTADTVYYAAYTAALNKYTVTWHDADGEVIASEQLSYGDTPSYSGNTPSKEQTSQYTYSFDGWTDVKGGEKTEGALPAVTEDAGYYAVYRSAARKYTITWSYTDAEGAKKTEEEKEYGDRIIPPENPADYTDGAVQYTFDMWEPTPDGEVTKDAEYTAMYSSAAVTYSISYVLNGHGSESDLEGYREYAAGSAAELPVLSEDGAVFGGWYTDAALKSEAEITESTSGNQTFYAKWTAAAYTVTWKNGDEVLETDADIAYGTAPSYNKDNPSRAADAQYVYSFAGWTDDASVDEVKYTAQTLPAVTEDAVYYAVFSRETRKYTVTWKNGTQTLKTDTDVPYGETAEYTGSSPSKESDEDYSYSFAGWRASGETDIMYRAGSMPEIKGDTVYEAAYSSLPKKLIGNVSFEGGFTNKNDNSDVATAYSAEFSLPSVKSYDKAEVTWTITAGDTYDSSIGTTKITKPAWSDKYTEISGSPVMFGLIITGVRAERTDLDISAELKETE